MQPLLRLSARAAGAAISLLCVVGTATAAPPQTPPSVQQYIETIPTATGGKPVGESTPSVHTGGSSSGVDTVGAVGGSSGAGSSSTTTPPGPPRPNPPRHGARTGGGKAAASDDKTSAPNPVAAAGRASDDGGLNRATLLGIVLGGMTLCALAFAALRRRAQRR